MKKALFYLAIASLSFLACSKSDDNGPSSSTDVSTTVFYTDTFNIYSTDLKGGNRKLVVSEGPYTGNNYFRGTAYVAKSKKMAYLYTEAYNKPFFLRTCNLDGTDKKTIKTFAAYTNVGIIKATAEGKIIYTLPGQAYPNQTASKVFSMNVDGTGETEVIVPFYAGISNPELISADGKGVLSEQGYFALMVNGVFDERNSFNLLLNEDKDQTKIRNLTMARDASKAAFIQTTGVDRKYEVRIKDVKKDAPVATVLYTVNINTEANDGTPGLTFVNGSKNILVSYGKFTSPKGSANDYTYCELIDTSNGKVVQSWKFMGDDIYRPFTD
ncbi:hypothetical protein [Pedobacter arcticus]|uniref:hypothetical protein n=1 Tax=Pedobacter arcticus TaxID=752140 RepID=UPI0002F9E457|nr:hypothetical protein [Pedobacter arcticus]